MGSCLGLQLSVHVLDMCGYCHCAYLELRGYFRRAVTAGNELQYFYFSFRKFLFFGEV